MPWLEKQSVEEQPGGARSRRHEQEGPTLGKELERKQSLDLDEQGRQALGGELEPQKQMAGLGVERQQDGENRSWPWQRELLVVRRSLAPEGSSSPAHGGQNEDNTCT